MEWRCLNSAGANTVQQLKYVQEIPQQDRVPKLNRYESTISNDFFIDIPNVDETTAVVPQQSQLSVSVSKSIRDRSKNTVNNYIHDILQDSIVNDLIWNAVLEILQDCWHQTTTTPITFTRPAIVNRIKTGITLCWNAQRASRRSDTNKTLWKVCTGGRIAHYLETLQIFSTENPHIFVWGHQILEYLVRKHNMDGNELDLDTLYDTNKLSDLDIKIVANVLNVDPNWLVDSHLQIQQQQQSSTLTVVVKNSKLEREIKLQQKQAIAQQQIQDEWEQFRTKDGNICFHNNTPWLEYVKTQLPVMVTFETSSSGRRTNGVYYGSRSSTPKQLQELILRTLSNGPKTMAELQHDNMKRLRSALGTLLWRRNQISVYPLNVNDLEPEAPATTNSRLDTYIYELVVTELKLRKLIVENLTYIKPEWIAVVADEGDNLVDMDAIWQSSGHELIHKQLWRPGNQYTIDAFLPPIPVANHTSGTIGRAKEPNLMERRLLFRAVSSTDSIILSEPQVRAGMRALELVNEPSSTSAPHPLPAPTEVALFQNNVEVLIGTVVGHTRETHDKILILPKAAGSTAFWATLLSTSDGLVCETDTQRYSIQQFDFDESSLAYQSCLKIVQYLQRHPKGLVFQEPVDPIRLGIPQYRDIIKHPMDVSTLLAKLQRGDYSTPPPISSNPIVRMMNGPFRKDVELIFDNAMLFNPPDDWIHLAAASIKKSVIKKIEQACQTTSSLYRQQSLYVDEDSDVDMYEYESDDDYTGKRRNKRKRGASKSPAKEDHAARVMEGGIRLSGNTLGLNIVSNPNEFTLPPEWGCRHKLGATEQYETTELDLLLDLYKQLEETEHHVGVRRSTRAADHQHEKEVASGTPGVEYFCSETEELPTNRLEVEVVRENLHEELAKQYRDSGHTEYDPAGVFPPFLGRVVGTSWEIRPEKVQAALRWVIRGLIQSQHVAELEPLDGPEGGIIIPNNIYYIDETKEPYDQLIVRQVRKAESSESEEELELSAYEQARAERVERNKQRLEALGLV